MPKLPPLTAIAVALFAWVQQPVSAAPADTAKATDRCEAEVSETIRRMRGRDAKEVQFLAAKRVLLPSGDDETAIKGEGRYRGAGGSVSFNYSCAYSAASDTTSGVVFRDAGAARAVPEKAFEPDLTNVSPEACEAAAAAALKRQHPRVGRINFGADSRRMQPGTNGRVDLVGKGSVERASGMNLIPFSYRCQVEPRSGKVLDISTTE